MATRCLRYNTQLVLLHKAPVLSTVMYLFPPKPTEEPVFRVVFEGREINRWGFEEVCLWELDARESLERGAPGLLALVPLMRGGVDLGVVQEAAGRIERAFPQEQLSDAEDVLLALASRYHTVEQLARIVGRYTPPWAERRHLTLTHIRCLHGGVYREGSHDPVESLRRGSGGG